MELMISTFLTLVVLATSLGGLSDGLKMQENAGLSSEMHHNTRTAMNEMMRDFLQAGQGIPTGGIAIPSGTGALPVARPGPGSLEFDATWQTLPAVAPGNALGPDIQGRQTGTRSIESVERCL